MVTTSSGPSSRSLYSMTGPRAGRARAGGFATTNPAKRRRAPSAVVAKAERTVRGRVDARELAKGRPDRSLRRHPRASPSGRPDYADGPGSSGAERLTKSSRSAIQSPSSATVWLVIP